MTTYRVQVTREGDQWLADVPELEGASTYAANLTALDRYVREVVVLAADLPDSAMDGLTLDWSYNIGGDQLVAAANDLRARRSQLAAEEAQLEQATRRLAAELTSTRGFSVRDAGPLLGISYQRVSQITPERQSAGQAAAAANRSAPVKAAATRATKKAPAKKVTKKAASRALQPSAAPVKALPRKAAAKRATSGSTVRQNPVSAAADMVEPRTRKAK